MLILAADTSGSNCSVALMQDHILLGEYNMNFGKQHSVLLMPMIEDLMAKTGITQVNSPIWPLTWGQAPLPG